MNKAGKCRENDDFYGGQQVEKERRTRERRTLDIKNGGREGDREIVDDQGNLLDSGRESGSRKWNWWD